MSSQVPHTSMRASKYEWINSCILRKITSGGGKPLVLDSGGQLVGGPDNGAQGEASPGGGTSALGWGAAFCSLVWERPVTLGSC